MQKPENEVATAAWSQRQSPAGRTIRVRLLDLTVCSADPAAPVQPRCLLSPKLIKAWSRQAQPSRACESETKSVRRREELAEPCQPGMFGSVLSRKSCRRQL